MANSIKIIQIATIAYNSSAGEYLGTVEQLVALTSDGKLFVRNLNSKGSEWEPLRGPVEGINIGGPAHADKELLL